MDFRHVSGIGGMCVMNNLRKSNETDCAIIIPIYQPDYKWNECLKMLKKQKNITFDVYVADSGSDKRNYRNDIIGLNYTFIKTTPESFNHGRTRQEAAEACKHYPILVYMTQDAIPKDEYAISHLVKAFENSQVGCAYGRQLPHKDATILAARARAFNYPPQSRVKSLQDADELGIKVSFISDTFAAYRTKALEQVEGFPTDVILGEDTYVASKMILSGWSNAYCADAQVYHSHNYTILQEFRRYFDTGVFHATEPWIRKSFGQAEGEGIRFVVSELKFLLKRKPLLIIPTIVRDGCKLVGYKLGLHYRKMPNFLRRQCSMMKVYWK